MLKVRVRNTTRARGAARPAPGDPRRPRHAHEPRPDDPQGDPRARRRADDARRRLTPPRRLTPRRMPPPLTLFLAPTWPRPSPPPARNGHTRRDVRARFGQNAFGLDEMKARLPKAVVKRLLATVDRGEPFDETVADAVALAMKEWAVEKGATHYTHWFQPLTGRTAEKHDAFMAPSGGRRGRRRVLGQEPHPGRARRLQLPRRRPPGHVRGARLHGLRPDEPGLHRRAQRRRDALHPDGLRDRGRARRSTTRSRCCARWRR